MNVDHLHTLRRIELENALADSPFDTETAKVLEIGSGTGEQLLHLQQRCAEAVGVDLAESNYATARVTDILEYDGHHLPFEDASFDGLFSSNVMEHIPHFDEFQRELQRVLKPTGWAIHIVPTTTWRLWTTLAHWPAMGRQIGRKLTSRFLASPSAAGTAAPTAATPAKSSLRRIANLAFPEPHGEFGNRFTEVLEFHPSRWRERFERTGWSVVRSGPTGLFYTGYSLTSGALPGAVRRKLHRLMGSACWTFYLQRA